MADEPVKSMLDDINADLAELAQTGGPRRVAEMIADRWGLDAAEVVPYIIAVSLHVAFAYDQQLLAEPETAFKRARNCGYYAIRAAIAAERVGWDFLAESDMQLGPYKSASELAANTFPEEVDDESEHTH